jgi:hypothetical protein
VRQKGVQFAHLFRRFIPLETPGCGYKFFEVLDPTFAALAFLLAEMLDQSRRVNDLINNVVQR